VAGCGTSAGTRFNLEPRTNARFQNTQVVDVLRNRVAAGVDLVVGGSWDWRHLGGDSATGYYVSRDADCAPEVEGGLPAVAAFDDRGLGNPVVAADPARDAIFMADLRLTFDDRIGIGVFRTTAATLLSSSACPNGTHTNAQASTCWPKRRLLNPVDYLDQQPQDKPHLAVDERASGTGAGDVYVTATQFDFGTSASEIWLVACRNDLSACSAPTIISGSDPDTQFSHVAVRPEGGITITYINVADFGNSFDIKYVRCTPRGAPTPPSCSAPMLVHHETQPLRFGGFLGAHGFPIATYPKHDHRADTNGTETYVVWDRCKVAPISSGLANDACVCPDADVVLKASRNNGATWSSVTGVNTGTQDQFLPAIRTDRSRNIVNIAYYSSNADATFQHRVRLILHHINPGSATPDPLCNTPAYTSDSPPANSWRRIRFQVPHDRGREQSLDASARQAARRPTPPSHRAHSAQRSGAPRNRRRSPSRLQTGRPAALAPGNP
jgi:hypothetical protein